MQNLTKLYHFRLVAQEGSFAKAAELAHITTPALSNSIRSLEEQLGLTLFERSERPVTLTVVGRSILDRVDAVLFEARNLDQLLENLYSGQSGHIRVGMASVFSTSLGGPIIAEWHEQHPNVKIDLEVAETKGLVEGLRDEVFDLIVGDSRDLRENVDDLDLIALPPQAGGAFCRAGHPILDIRNPLPQDLARYRFAGTRFPDEVIRMFSRFLGRTPAAHAPIIAIESSNIAALRDAVAESNLILLTAAGAVRNALALGILRQIPIDLGIEGVWHVATRRGRVQQPAVPSLVNKIVEFGKRETERRMVPYVGAHSGG